MLRYARFLPLSFMAIAACLADTSKGGTRDARDVEDDAEDTSDAIGDSVESDTGDDADTTPPDSAADTAPDTSPGVCGDNLIGPGEACDDGNTCLADGCMRCMLDRSLVLTRLELDDGAGFDLDDADGDRDPHTGRDNRIGSSAAVATAMNDYIRDLIDSGEVIQLATFTNWMPSSGTPDLVLHPGVDPVCGQDGTPWLDAPFTDMRAEALPDCRPPVQIGDVELNDRRVIVNAPRIELPLGALGTFPIARARLEAELRRTDDGRFERLEGQLGGILPAAALYMIDTSALLPECPTALHAVLGLAGHLDQDVDGDGRVDFIRWTTEANTMPCIDGPVVISGCCLGGSCEGEHLVPGRDCVLDPRVRDGYSVGFRVRANGVNLVGTAPACE